MARVWLVTGASRGLGRSIAEVVLQSGDSVVATARKPELLSDLVDQYGPDRVLTVGLDVTNQEEATHAVDTAVQKFGRIDVLVNNAGVAVPSAIEDADMQVFKTQIDANFYGVVNVTRAVLPIMRNQRSGHIMQISTIGGRAAGAGLAAYSSAKWAVTGFSHSLSHEVAPYNIKVTVMEPGGMKTEMAETFSSTKGISELYEPSVKGFFQAVISNQEHWSETADVARALVHVSKLEDPPLRLLLGRDTIKAAKGIGAMMAAADEKFQYVTAMSPEVIA